MADSAAQDALAAKKRDYLDFLDYEERDYNEKIKKKPVEESDKFLDNDDDTELVLFEEMEVEAFDES